MRAIFQIAREIAEDWKKPSPYAVPYIQAMKDIHSLNDDYYCDSGRSVVLYFLSNAGTWRGEVAKRIKKELKDGLAKG